MDEPGQLELRSYGMLAMPLAVAGLPLYLHVPDFYMTEKGLNLALIGGILLLIRIIDAVQDPLIGALSDRWSGCREGAIMAGLAGLGIGMVALLVPSQSAGALWFTVWVVLTTTCYSLASINLNTIGGIWSRNSFGKTRIASTRERFGMIGLCLGVMVPGILVVWVGKPVGFAMFAGGLLVLLGYTGWRFQRWASANRHWIAGKENSAGARFNPALPRSKGVRSLVLVTFSGALASSLPAVLFLFFVRDRLKADHLAWLFLLVYFLSAVAGIPFWRDLSRRTGKVRSWCVSLGFAMLAFAGAAFAGPEDLVLYGMVCLLTGLALGGDLVFPASLMAGLVDRTEAGQTHATSGFAWLSFAQKAGLGLAAGISFPLLEGLGYQSGQDNGRAATMALVGLYAGIPLGLKLTSTLLLWAWRNHVEPEIYDEDETDLNRNRAPASGLDSHRMQKPNEN